jgi:hypothetical protein
MPRALLQWPPERVNPSEVTSQVLAIGVGFKPDSPDWRTGPVLQMMRNEGWRARCVYAWDDRLTPHELVAINRDSEAIGGPRVLGPEHPIPDVTGGVVYLFTSPPQEWLMEARDVLVIDPYALLKEHHIRKLKARGCRYIRRGIGRESA